MHATTKGIVTGLVGAVFGVGMFVLVIFASGGSIVAGPVPMPVPRMPTSQGGQPGAENQPIEGPWTKDLRMRWSDNGTVFGEASTFVERAGVPSVIEDVDGRLIAVFQWFPEDDAVAFDKVAVAFSEDAGATWAEPQLMVINGMPPGYQRPFDPTIVQLEDGRYRLYFTSSEKGPGDNRRIFSAISDDAITYAVESGERVNVTGEVNYDAAALLVGETWHLTTPGPGGPGSLYHTTSADGVNFGEPLLIGEVGGVLNWTGNLLADGVGMRFYGSSTDGLWWAYSADGENWTDPTMIAGDGGQGGDPAVVQVGDRFLMVYVSDKVR